MQSLELKIKSKSLAEEAKIIRWEEKKLKAQMKWARFRQLEISNFEKSFFSINNHRRIQVRNENRATFLARSFIAGIPYSVVEQCRKPENETTFWKSIVPRILTMVNKYGLDEDQKSKDDIKNWIRSEHIKNVTDLN